jgi:hypothetical protein
VRIVVEVLAQSAPVGSGPPGDVRLEVVTPSGHTRVTLEAGPHGELVMQADDLVADPVDVLCAVTAAQWSRLAIQAERLDHWEYRSIDGLAWRDSLPAEMMLLQPVLAALAAAAGDRAVMAKVAAGHPVVPAA